MSSRSKARKAALDFLYEGDIRNRSAVELLAARKNELEYLIRDYTERNFYLRISFRRANAVNISSLVPPTRSWMVSKSLERIERTSELRSPRF